MLSPIIDGAITDSVTPYAVGTLVSGAVAVCAFLWADGWRVPLERSS